MQNKPNTPDEQAAIVLHHVSLSSILPSIHGRLTADDREFIRRHRHTLLSNFCQNQQLPIPIYDKDNYGKPFTKNIANLAFNQSHCQSDYVLIYSLTVTNIGVDIENINRKVNFKSLAQHYFHSDEYHLWQKHDMAKTFWFRIWTIKEAVLKAHGLGIRLNLNELNAMFIDEYGGVVFHKKIGKFYFKNIIINDCMITLAYPFKFANVDIIMR